MTNGKRLDKIEECLTPKQAVLVWLQQANTHANAHRLYQVFNWSSLKSCAL